MKSFRLLVLGLLATTLITAANLGCNTTEGAGKDIERAGEKIQDAAD